MERDVFNEVNDLIYGGSLFDGLPEFDLEEEIERITEEEVEEVLEEENQKN